ncbi:hybrid sensor histidine kinase/response regulator [Oceanidesulfovibrio indonesiensis]|uniref:histidine kinase n=1 Tax=Oceanidesulfovibrio indonesiensis TaxID=54767 RepID=A0A7M3MC21_9BACT|nr:response regulator [Oceanidesulfovibrio indonesiensis]TVM15412.1 hybrid sensor histidine kinase/response regulator [Oceanidesulfovibrio indonesiensis]
MADRVFRKRLTAYEELADFPERIARVEKERESGPETREESLRLVLSNAPFGVALLSANLDILYLNDAARNLLTLEGGVPVNWQAVGEAVHEGEQQRLVDLVRFAGKTQGEQAAGAFDLQLCGCVRNLEFRATRLRDGRAVVGFADATERREAEKALRRSHQELERLVRERTRELEAANNAKRDFLSNMSHELRTPLNGILGMSEILKDSSLDGEQRLCLNAIRQSGHEMLRIVNNLLDLSKAEAGRMALRPRDFDLRRTVQPVIEVFQRRALDKGLTFNATIDKSVPHEVHGDPERLKQVVFNLLDNAVKFTREGCIAFCLRMARQVEAGRIPLCIEVRDTGPGIAPEQAAYIFDSFYMGEELLTKKHAGAGLGLPIARHVAATMDGDVHFEPDPQGGSLFVANVVVGQHRGVWTQQEPARQPMNAPDALDVLLVEDEEVSRMYVRLLLEKMGHHVTVAVNGVEALRLLGENRFDLVITDIQMPEMDGITAVEHIRGARKGYAVQDASIPVVALTVFAHNDDRERILAADVDEYVTKPVESARLAEAMRNAMSKRGRS